MSSAGPSVGQLRVRVAAGVLLLNLVSLLVARLIGQPFALVGLPIAMLYFFLVVPVYLAFRSSRRK